MTDDGVFIQRKYFEITKFNFLENSFSYFQKIDGTSFEKEVQYRELLPGISKLRDTSVFLFVCTIVAALFWGTMTFFAFVEPTNTIKDIIVVSFILSVPMLCFLALYLYSVNDYWFYRSVGGHNVLILNTKDREKIAEILDSKIKLMSSTGGFVEDELEETIQ